MLLPGIKVNTTPTDYYPVQQLQLMRFDGQALGTLWGPAVW
jgi:branched-chain amino acid transport system substrate-binding protein